MTLFPFQIGEVTGLYQRVLKTRRQSLEADLPETKDVVSISAEAKRRKILEEIRDAVPARVPNSR